MTTNTGFLLENDVPSTTSVKLRSVAVQRNSTMSDSGQITGNYSSRMDGHHFPEIRRSIVNFARESQGGIQNVNRNTNCGQILQAGSADNDQLARNCQHNVSRNVQAQNLRDSRQTRHTQNDNTLEIGAKYPNQHRMKGNHSATQSSRVYKDPDVVTDASPFFEKTENEDRQSQFPQQQTIGIDEAKKVFGCHEYLDAAIVYAKEDYDEVTGQFMPWLKKVCESMDTRIVLYDDDIFPPHNIESIEYVIERSMRVLIYLTKNFIEEGTNMRFLTSEAISNTRLANPFSLSEQILSQRKWAVRPVHTKSDNERNYKTPTGLTSVRGIDFYNRNRSHTKDKARKLIEDAISYRLIREMEETSKMDSNVTSSEGASNCDYSTSDQSMRLTIPATLSPSDVGTVRNSNSLQNQQLSENGLDDKSNRVLSVTNETESSIVPPTHSRDNNYLPDSQVAQNVRRQERAENPSMPSVHSEQASVAESVQNEKVSVAESVQNEKVSVAESVQNEKVSVAESVHNEKVSVAESVHNENASNAESVHNKKVSVAEPVIDQEGTEGTNTFVSGHSPPHGATQRRFDTQNNTENRVAAADSITSNVQEASRQSQVQGQPSSKNNDQESRMTETDGCQTDNLTAETEPEESYTPDKSLEIDAKPFKSSNVDTTPSKGVKVANQQNLYENYGDVIENVMSYHGHAERHVPPCASAPRSRRPDEVRENITHAREAVQTDSNNKNKYSGGPVIHKVYHYHKTAEPPQINIVGCGVVQIGNDTTVANSSVSAANKDTRTKKPKEANTKDRKKETTNTERKESFGSLPSDVSHDYIPSGVSQEHGTSKNEGQGTMTGAAQPSMNILSPEADKTITSQDFTNGPASFNTEDEVTNSNEEQSDEDNSLQASNNDLTEEKDILDDMLLPDDLKVPSNWTSVKSASNEGQMLNSPNLKYSEVEDDSNWRHATNTAGADKKSNKKSSSSKSSMETNSRMQPSVPDSQHSETNGPTDISNNKKDNPTPDERFSETQMSMLSSSDGYSTSLSSSKCDSAISNCVDVKSFGERRRYKTCPIKLLTSSCSSTPDFSSAEAANESTDEVN